MTCLGPSFDPEELAGRKLIALFDRAAARDFSDVHALAARYGKRLLMDRAAEVDAGFDPGVLAQMFAKLSRIGDRNIPVAPADVPALRAFFAEWAAELNSAS
ncbi:nucleotidyl transferase AbiEii/AbiGii toxin family protein [Kutzneria chonburiensis]|uniref:Nucleotidyl transferase AbiEii/AbiGii toxin family protein n=1 Tax=Kutzneria chonburiensis TaxID=1483604 RepID=A0ABV6N2K5_9PSEU|nr:nucleotidyl transferase AbiEii/AbiGii toxin family protein [Kutzneria chonburiensis]